jgi:phosphotransferase system HPr-like phosphotransfer protein
LNFNGRFDSVQKFVNLTGEFKDIEVWSSDNHWRVDAHSLLGILSLDISKQVNLIYHDDEKNRIIETFREWIVCE